MKFTVIKNIVFSVVLIIMLPFAVYAAPSITSISGAVVHGQAVIVNGSGFGVKSPVAPLMWDPVDGVYTGLVNGSGVPTGGTYPWGSTSGNETVYYKTINPRGKWTAKYSNDASKTSGVVAGSGTAALDGAQTYTQSAGAKLYISWWMYYSGATLDHGNNSNKFYRLGATPNWATETIQWEPTLVQAYDFTSGSYVINSWPSYTGAAGVWNRNETIVDNTTNPKPAMTLSLNNTILFSGLPNTSLPVDIQAIQGIGFDASNSSNQNPVIDFGEIYVDNTTARVEICNASTKTSSTHCEIQIPQTTWNDGQLQIKVNQGSFADGTAAYLFVVDASGNVSSGNKITFGGSTPTGPTAPKNLKVTAQ